MTGTVPGSDAGMGDLVRLLEAGNLASFIILALLLALVYAVRQWRQAEADKDKLHEARLEDAKEMVTLAAEVKNILERLVYSSGDK